MADVPEGVAYGRVTGRFVAFRADGPDSGNVPDEIPLSGTVTLTPLVTLVKWPTLDPPRTATVSSVVATVVNGNLVAPEGSGELWVIATDQPLGQPNRIQWRATFNLAGAGTQPAPVVFDVPTGGVVDLTTVIPAATQPGTVTVVSDETRVAAEAAADRAEQAKDDTEALLANAELTDTGWVSFTPSTGWDLPTTGVAPEYRIKNDVVYFRGAVSSPAGGTGMKPPLILPAATTPTGGPKPRRTVLALATAPAIVQGWVLFPGTAPEAIGTAGAALDITDLDLSMLTWPL